MRNRQEETDGGKGRGRRTKESFRFEASSTSTAVLLWAKLKANPAQRDMENRDIHAANPRRLLLCFILSWKIEAWIKNDESDDRKQWPLWKECQPRCLMDWISGDPRVKITGAYRCGHKGQTYSSRCLLDSCLNKDIIVTPEPPHIQLLPLTFVSHTYGARGFVFTCDCEIKGGGWPGLTGEDIGLLIVAPGSGLRGPGSRI